MPGAGDGEGLPREVPSSSAGDAAQTGSSASTAPRDAGTEREFRLHGLLSNIIAAASCGNPPDEATLDSLIRRSNAGIAMGEGRIAKRDLLPAYLRELEEDTVDVEAGSATDLAVRSTLRMKPRRSASGVATITVITMPWPCSGRCAFCPSDLSMPKSYLASEPACQRALACCFDPYLQASRRLYVLGEMGHITDKVEMIVLGGTWDDYPASYRTWFVAELYRALIDGVGERARDRCREIEGLYGSFGVTGEALYARAAEAQTDVDSGSVSYNDAVGILYGDGTPWSDALAARMGRGASPGELAGLQEVNSSCEHRMVGLSLETRPDRVSAASLVSMRELGCTKVQLGIQSTSDCVLTLSGREATSDASRRAMALVRLMGFKSHVHFMPNLPGSDIDSDLVFYRAMFDDPSMRPDEVKLYPCSLVGGTPLVGMHERGEWAPYTETQLVDLLTKCVLATPGYCRISRMVRDISAEDIIAGNRKVNLRQMVDSRLKASGVEVCEIRSREVGTKRVLPGADAMKMSEIRYETSTGTEHFLQWTFQQEEGGPEMIASFCRLSIPSADALSSSLGIPISSGEAMIRELHVYGRVSGISDGPGEGIQHRGLGRSLVERACEIARDSGCTAVNVISAVGTRGYYRALGFLDAGLYQRKALI